MPYRNLSIRPLPASRVEIEGELLPEAIAARRPEALARLGASLELPGFRKGKIPERILLERLGERAILSEAAAAALKEAYPEMIVREGVDAIGSPEAELGEFPPGAPAPFRIRVSVLPALPLPDYRKIAASVPLDPPAPPPSEEDVSAFLLKIRRLYAEANKLPADPPPPLSDEIAKRLGFGSAAELSAGAKERLREENEAKRREKRRAAILEALAAAAPCELPELLIEAQISRMLARFSGDLSRMGLTLEGYLGGVKKTAEELRREWRPAAEKRARAELILEAIAKKENVAADPEELERELAHLAAHHPDAPQESVRPALEAALRNSRVLALLEEA